MRVKAGIDEARSGGVRVRVGVGNAAARSGQVIGRDWLGMAAQGSRVRRGILFKG